MTGEHLEWLYRERFEEDVIFALKERFGVTYELAMRWFYESNVAKHVYDEIHGMQYAGAGVVAEYLSREISDKNVLG